MIVVQRQRLPIELTPPPPTPSQRVLQVASTSSPLLLDWLPFQKESEDEEEEQERRFVQRPRPIVDRHPVSGLRALLAEEALGDFWEGFSRPKNKLQSLTDSWLACLSSN